MALLPLCAVAPNKHQMSLRVARIISDRQLLFFGIRFEWDVKVLGSKVMAALVIICNYEV